MHIRPNCEKRVASYLLSRNISYYVPLYRREDRYGNLGRTRITEIPLFRGYLCFALDRPNHKLLYGTTKFVRIIDVTDQERFVKELLAIARAIETGQELLVRPGLVPGRKALIRSGPLEGTEGVVVGTSRERRVALSVKMFNQTVLVKLDPFTVVEAI